MLILAHSIVLQQQFRQFHSGQIQFFPALDLGLVDEGKSSLHKGGGERAEDGGGEYISILAENREKGKREK
jgi:hypothetical protein